MLSIHPTTPTDETLKNVNMVITLEQSTGIVSVFIFNFYFFKFYYYFIKCMIHSLNLLIF